MNLKRYVIERHMPGVGSLGPDKLQAAAEKSNGVLRELGPGIQWIESFVTADRLYCIYLAIGREIIEQHADMTGFVASRISEVGGKIDPTTASA